MKLSKLELGLLKGLKEVVAFEEQPIYPPAPESDEDTDMYWDSGEYMEDGHPAMFNDGNFD